MSRKRRSVRYEASFEEAKRTVEADARRFDEMCAGIDWLMENDAEACPEMLPGPFRLARAREPGGSYVRVLFTINSDEQVSAWWVDRSLLPQDSEEDES